MSLSFSLVPCQACVVRMARLWAQHRLTGQHKSLKRGAKVVSKDYANSYPVASTAYFVFDSRLFPVGFTHQTRDLQVVWPKCKLFLVDCKVARGMVCASLSQIHRRRAPPPPSHSLTLGHWACLYNQTGNGKTGKWEWNNWNKCIRLCSLITDSLTEASCFCRIKLFTTTSSKIRTKCE